jgi:hypothetical protein
MEFQQGGEDGNSSKFNAGMLLIQRIHKELDKVNDFKDNPAAWNEQRGDWNYNLIFRGITKFYTETQSKFGPKEKEECEKYQKAISDFLKANPIIQNKSMIQFKNNVQVNQLALNIVVEHLQKYEQFVRSVADGRGFMSPNQRDKKKAILRM